jgi:hypothetical protein
MTTSVTCSIRGCGKTSATPWLDCWTTFTDIPPLPAGPYCRAHGDVIRELLAEGPLCNEDDHYLDPRTAIEKLILTIADSSDRE